MSVAARGESIRSRRTQKAPGFRGPRGSTATGIRTRVSAMRGRRPSPLDDSGAGTAAPRLAKRRAPIPSLAGVGARGVRRCARTTCVRYLRYPHGHADVAELVDAHGSGPCLGNQVEVRVLSSAPFDRRWNQGPLKSGGLGRLRGLGACRGGSFGGRRGPPSAASSGCPTAESDALRRQTQLF